MHSNGDAAEQVVRLSLEGLETTVKLTGTASKHLAVLLYTILKQEQKTRGKARLTSMIKSGKELKVFAIPQKDLETFVKHAKQYGVLYCLIKDKTDNPDMPVDIISRAEDAAKIQRIFDRYKIGTVEQTVSDKEGELTPFTNRTEKEPLSGRNSMKESMQDKNKPSVKEKLQKLKGQAMKHHTAPAKEVSLREAAGR